MDAERLLQLLWTEAWQIAVVAAAVAVIVRIACRHRPHLAYALWLVVLLKCLTPPLWSSPTGVFSWAAAHYEQQISAPAETAESNSVGREAMFLRGTPAAVRPPIQSLPLRQADVVDATAIQRPTIALVGIWLLGSLIAASWFIARVVAARSSLSGSRIAPTEELLQLTAELCRLFGIRKVPELVVTRQPFGPALAGLFRSKIILPAAIVRRKPTSALRPILAHELVHLRRRDLWTALVQCMARIVWWFHPAVWLVDRELERLREQCCDEEVIAGLNYEPSRYAETLLDVLRLRRRLRQVGFAPGMTARHVTSERLNHIIRDAARFRRRAPRRYRLLFAIGGLIILPGTGIVLRDKPVLAQGENNVPHPPAQAPSLQGDFRWRFEDGADSGILECPSVTFYSKVTDSAGKPVAGATVRVVCSSILNPVKLQAILDAPPRADGPPGLNTMYTTDARGEYGFTLLPDQPFAPWPIIGATISHPGFASQRIWPHDTQPPAHQKAKRSDLLIPTVKLSPAQEIKGTIIDPQGNPLAGVYLADGESNFGRIALSGGAASGVGLTETDDQGRFRIVVAAGEDVELFGRAPDPRYPDFCQKLGRKRGDVGSLKIPSGRRLSIQVVDLEGKPLAGVPVEVVPSSAQQFLGSPVKKTGPDGRFMSRAVPPGDCVIFAFDEDGTLNKAFDMQLVHVSETGPTKPTVVYEVPHVTFRGRVVDTAGKPLDTMLVWTPDTERARGCDALLHNKQPGTFSLTVPLESPPPPYFMCEFFNADLRSYDYRVRRGDAGPWLDWPNGLKGFPGGLNDLVVVGNRTSD
jgi:beta-lactamase regulating signal transducer with metallopeptidase domain/protocatechuate 3,4-dioxygenase beta subunit